MKNFNLSFKSVMYMKTRRILTLILLFTISVGQMWASTYYYHGNKNSWGYTPMNVSADGFYEYYETEAKSNNNFLVSYDKNGSKADYNYDAVANFGFNGADMTNNGKWNGDNNICFYDNDQKNACYILVYYPNTTVNSAASPKVCASHFLPDYRSCPVYFVDAQSWAGTLSAYAYYSQNDKDAGNNAAWPGETMTSTGQTYNGKTIYSKTLSQTYDIVIFTNKTSGDKQTGNIPLGTTYKGQMYDNTSTSADWRALQIDIAFDDEGGSGSSCPSTATVGSTMPTITTAPTKTGYDFGGYWDGDNGTGIQYWNANKSGARTCAIDGPNRFYAKWTAKTYSTANNIKESDGSTNAGTYTATYDATSITYNTTPSKTGYNLEGLYKETSLANKIVNNDRTLVSSSAYTASGTSKWNQTSAPTLYVKWQAKTYSISLSRNGSGSADGTATATYDGALSSISAPTYSGFHVEGYYKEPELTNKIANGDGSLCTGTAYTDGSGHWTQDGAVTLYAKWEADASYYTLNYGVHASGHGSLAATNTSTGVTIANGSSVAANTGVTMTAEPDSYYEVEGWYNSSDCNVALGGWGTTNPKAFTLDNNYTVYVKFKLIDYTINYDLDGGSNHVSNPATYTYETAAITLGEPTKDGYDFGGWWTTSTFDEGTDVVVIPNHSSGNKTLYAKWTATSNAITYNDANSVATVTSNPANATTGSTVEFTVTLKPGFKDLDVTATDAGSNSVTVTNLSSNTYRFTMPTSAVTVTISATALPVVYVMKTQSPTSAWTGFESAGAASNIKIWAWATNEDNTYNFYDQQWGSRYAANSAKATVITDAVGNEWYRFIPDQNLEHFGGSKTYEVIITSGSTNIYNTGSTHYVDAIQYNNTTNTDRTGSVWIVPHGTSENSAYLYTYPDPGTTAYSVTYNAGVGGSINVFGTEIAANGSQSISTPNVARTITAANDAGYTFAGWTVTGGASVADASSATTTVSASAAGTVTATWTNNTIYYINSQVWEDADGDGEGEEEDDVFLYGWKSAGDPPYGAWPGTAMTKTASTVTIAGRTFAIYKMELVPADVDLKFIFNNGKSDDNKQQSIAGGIVATSLIGKYFMPNDCYGLNTTPQPSGGIYASIEAAIAKGIDCYKDHMVTFGVVGSTGGTIAGRNTTTNSDISSGTIVGLTDAISLTATPEEGYAIEGWYSDAEGSSNINHNKTPYSKTFTSSDGDITVYVRFEALHTVTLSAENGTVQVEGEDATSVDVASNTTATITAVPAAGYYFNDWTIPDGVTNESGSAVSTSANPITIKTSADGKTVTANFVPDDKIYFDNTYTQWSKVYVYLFANDSYWTNSGQNGVHPQVNRVAYAEMTLVDGEENLYEYAYHTSVHNYSFSYVAFSADDMHTYDVFGSGKHAAYRGDWTSNLPVYVATAGYESVQINKDDAVGGGYGLYHSGGYWRAYNPKAGESVYYYLDIFSGTATFDDGQYFKASGDGALVAEVSARLTDPTTDYTIGVHSVVDGSSKDQHYAEPTTITVNNSDDIIKLYKYNSDWNITLTTTSEGIYTFVLSQEYDSLRLSVIYPASVGDYRLKYAYGSPTKYRSSDIIKKKVADTGVAVKTSMYVDPTDANAQLIVERCNSISAGVPVWGTKVTFDNTYLNNNFKQNSVATKGVYEMDVTIAGTEGNASTLTAIAPYTGPYYIKTNTATGGWADYKKNALTENTINFSKSDSKTFDYYFCTYINDAGTNIKCVIANDYNNAVSDTLVDDDILGTGVQTLPRAGSVRFSYNSSTNALRRAYISGSYDWSSHYLALQAGSAVIKTRGGATYTDNKVKFTDNGNWIYNLELQAQEGARIKLISQYNDGSANHDQYFKGLAGDFSEANTEELIGSNGGSTWQPLTIIYDFKTNNLISAWSPTCDIEGAINLKTDILLIHNRKKITNPAPTEVDVVSLINFTGESTDNLTNINKVYSAFRFQKNADATYVGLQDAPANSAAIYYQYNYWISFPYEVKMTDIFGLSGYGSKWRIQRHRGDLRAQNGWYMGDGVTSFWETVPMNDQTKLNKGEGYVLQLSPSAFQATGTGSFWELSNEVYLYFPSKDHFGSIVQNASFVDLTQPGYECTKGAFTDGSGKSHNMTDSYWHVFGVPTFNNATAGTTKGTGHDYYDDGSDGQPEDHNISNADFYFYKYNNTANSSEYNTYTVTSSSGFTFQPMHAYMIQMHGTLNFTTNSVPASVAARRSGTPENYTVRLELAADGVEQDRTFVTLRDEAAADFALNEDMMKIHNSGRANIYSYAGAYDVASNILPVESRTVTLGVEVAADGTYTFRMPADISGTVTLLDNQTNTRTNLSAGDYEVYLAKGTYEGRFFLEIDVREVTTVLPSYDGYSDSDHVLKFVRDGHLFIRRRADTFDARGNRVR